MSTIAKLIDSIENGDNAATNENFLKVIQDKVTTHLDIKKVAITSDIYKKIEKETT